MNGHRIVMTALTTSLMLGLTPLAFDQGGSLEKCRQQCREIASNVGACIQTCDRMYKPSAQLLEEGEQ